MNNLKPFNLEEALAGKTVKLLDGRKAYVRHHETEMVVEDVYRLVGYTTDGSFLSWCADGSYAGSEAQNNQNIIGMYPETRIINGFEVPSPETTELELGCTYFAPHLQADCYFARFFWDGDARDMRSLKRGVVFLNKEDAIANAKAMLGIDPYRKPHTTNAGLQIHFK